MQTTRLKGTRREAMMTVPCKCQESKDSETELIRLGHPQEMGGGEGEEPGWCGGFQCEQLDRRCYNVTDQK